MNGQDNSRRPRQPEKPGSIKRVPPSAKRPAPGQSKAPQRKAPPKKAPPRRPVPPPAKQRVPEGSVHNKPVQRKPVKARPAPKPKTFRRKASPEKKQHIAAVLILLLTLYLVINLAIFGILYFSFNKQPGNTLSYSLILKKDKSKVATIDAAQVNNEYGLYVPFSKLSLLADLSIMGDNNNVIIIVRPGNDRIEVSSNSSLVYINDNAIRLTKPVIFQINDYLLPIELINNYMDGISITYDSKKNTCTLFHSTESDVKISTKVVGPDGLGKCSFPNETTSYQTSSETSSEASSSTTSSKSSTSSKGGTSSTSSRSNTSSH